MTGGRVCSGEGTKCVSARVRYRIEGGKTLVQPNHSVATKSESDVITIEYWGFDDSRKKVRLKRTLIVSGAKAEVR